ncbi:MAG: hypothetical protein O3A88_05950 [Proteobacteria bacterium]|nr:hypothetical protein [Pseudomonadota bacterium]
MTTDTEEDRRKKSERRLGVEMRRVADRRNAKASKPPAVKGRSGGDRRDDAERRAGRAPRREKPVGAQPTKGLSWAD